MWGEVCRDEGVSERVKVNMEKSRSNDTYWQFDPFILKDTSMTPNQFEKQPCRLPHYRESRRLVL